jgi:PadR family transcriptional regulator
MRSKGDSRRETIDLLRGTLDMMILRTLQWGPQHGHGIGLAIRASSDEVLRIERGSLYPALHRLEWQGWVDAQWKMTENNQRAKYYSLTRAGRKQLLAETSRWKRMVQAVARVMRPA